VPRDGLADLAEVLLAELLKQRHLVGEPFEAVADAVREAGRAEPAIAAGSRPADGPRLKQNHVKVGVPLAGEQCGPQAGKPAPDDRQVRGHPVREGRPRLRRVGLVQPE
jgi:hypothetical protein